MYYKRCMTHQVSFSYLKLKSIHQYIFSLGNRTLIGLNCMRNSCNHLCNKSEINDRQNMGMHTHDVDPSKMTILDINGEMQLKDLMGSIVRVGYCIPVPDFYLLLNDLRCRKSIRQIHKEMK